MGGEEEGGGVGEGKKEEEGCQGEDGEAGAGDAGRGVDGVATRSLWSTHYYEGGVRRGFLASTVQDQLCGYPIKSSAILLRLK